MLLLYQRNFMRFFYGADFLVITPKYNVGNPSNDYGLGFYLTPDKEMARLWASKFPNGGFLIEYDVNIKGLKILKLNNNTDEDVLKWITILIAHRFSYSDRKENEDTIRWLSNHYSVDLTDVDVIIGYRADDSYFDYSRDFVMNNLSLELLKEAMELGKLGTQFVLMSKKAFKHIRYVKSEPIAHTDEYQFFRAKTKNEYRVIKKKDDINNTFIRDIMRGK